MLDQNQAEELASIDLKATLDWLATAPAIQTADELPPLHSHLSALRDTKAAAHQQHEVLDQLYARIHGVVQRLLPELKGVSLPLSRRTRHTVRGMQDLLLMVAEFYLRALGTLDQHLIKGLRRPPELTLWRVLDALRSHLLISNYAAAPATPGVWLLLHQAYQTGVASEISSIHVRGAEGTVEDVYLQTLLLSCAQPASFTSREIDLVFEYTQRFGGHAKFFTDGTLSCADGSFWIDPGRDAPPTASSRRPPPEGALCFTCEELSQLASEQLAALEADAAPAQLDLPDSANTPGGRGVIRRLAHYWGSPGKRRFPRRRQNYRAVLCVGLPALWQLFHDDETQAGEITSWMVTNESPDGYALMHVSGKTARIAAGDIVAIRTESASDWQICIARWALSENPEHLELGLQILATKATPALLASRSGESEYQQHPVLILPILPPIRLSEIIIAPCGTASGSKSDLILLIEKSNIEVREILAQALQEQTASIEVIAIENRYEE
ncbi:MAG: hypothetical protein H6943_09645 [Zoogloeaceae bacterium]|nr:hypothetical protein [Zoogloeaceae bacterium]